MFLDGQLMTLAREPNERVLNIFYLLLFLILIIFYFIKYTGFYRTGVLNGTNLHSPNLTQPNSFWNGATFRARTNDWT